MHEKYRTRNHCNRKMLKISQYCYSFCPMCITMIYQIGKPNKIKTALKERHNIVEHKGKLEVQYCRFQLPGAQEFNCCGQRLSVFKARQWAQSLQLTARIQILGIYSWMEDFCKKCNSDTGNMTDDIAAGLLWLYLAGRPLDNLDTRMKSDLSLA